MIVPAILIVGYAVLLVFRHIAIRRLGSRTGYAWLTFAPGFVFPAVILWLSISLVGRQPILGLVLWLVGLGYCWLLVRIARAAATASTPAEVIIATQAPTTDFVLITTILAVVGLIVLGIGMIVMAVAGGGI
jgi:hypothetical protein